MEFMLPAHVRVRRARVRGDGHVRRAGLGPLPHRAFRRGNHTVVSQPSTFRRPYLNATNTDAYDTKLAQTNLASVVPDIHQAYGGAARHGAPADIHGDRAEAPAGEQGERPAQAGEDGAA